MTSETVKDVLPEAISDLIEDRTSKKRRITVPYAATFLKVMVEAEWKKGDNGQNLESTELTDYGRCLLCRYSQLLAVRPQHY